MQSKAITSKNICVVGLGYIGLPTAALLASRGYQVVGVDSNPTIVNSVKSGCAHIAESDLDMLIEASVTSGKLKAATQVEPADIFIVAVQTPVNENKSPDLSAVVAAFDSIAPHLKKGDLIILESTCPVGTTDAMGRRLDEKRPDLAITAVDQASPDVCIAYCPERVLPGQILKELIENDRVVGGITPVSTQKAIEFYQSFIKGQCLATDSKTAEMCKLTENSFRDVNIAFANELSMICDQQGINVWELIKLANHHPRVNILQPGPGVGGHCIPVDPWFIINQFPEQSQLLSSSRAVNDSKLKWVIQKIAEAVEKLQEANKKPLIACLGITFKANVEDIRESPALEIVANLAKLYPNQIRVVEPNLNALPERLISQSVQTTTLDQATAEADLLVLLVGHTEFIQLPNATKEQIVLDFTGLWSK